MPTATPRDWITFALRKAGVIGLYEAMSPEDASAALPEFNLMLDSWSIEPGAILGQYDDGFPLVAGQAAYSTALFAQGRPVGILSGRATISTVDYAIVMNFSPQDYNAISYKPAQGIPRVCWYDEGMPNGTLTLWPTPYGGMQATFQCWAPLLGAGSLTLDSVMQAAPGYGKAIVDSFAVEACLIFQRPVSKRLDDGAREAKAWIKRHNHRPTDVEEMGLPAGSGNARPRYDIYGDT